MYQQIRVDFGYPVFFCRRVFGASQPVLADWFAGVAGTRPVRFLCFLDDGLVQARPELPETVARYARRHASNMEIAGPPLVLRGGEASKNSFDTSLKVIRAARRAHLCRHSVILAVGGGAFLDAVGFAASLVHRGLRMVRIPTTVLSQDDSGVGLKNGVNLGGVKNFLGTFAPPAAVFNDAEFLTTLCDRDWIAGTAEAVKVAAIEDRAFLDWLAKAAPALRRRDLDVMDAMIRRCARLHLRHIADSGDPFEFGAARPLDFGHWAAHKLETLTLHELRHGEAVAIGMALDLLYAAEIGFLPLEDALGVIRLIQRLGLPVWHDALDSAGPDGRPLVFHGIEEFREHLGGELHVTLPRPLGAKTEVHHLNENLLRSCIDRLRAVGTSTPHAPTDA